MSAEPQLLTALWEEDRQRESTDIVPVREGPDVELAIVLLAQGCKVEFIQTRAGFPTVQSVRTFAKDEDTRQAVKERRSERAERVSDRALVALERLLARPIKDTKAQVMAIRTALGVGQQWHREHAPQTKRVEELSVNELESMIALTRAEIERRTAIEPA